MNVSNQTAAQIKEVLDEIIKKFTSDEGNEVMTDLSFQVKQDSGELTVFDDNDEEIVSATIDEWIDNQDDQFQESVADVLRQAITNQKDALEFLSIIKPYSFILVDDESKETITELYLVDDNTIIFESKQLMEGLSEDLDNFINRLLAN